jgi:hypothetical protein
MKSVDREKALLLVDGLCLDAQVWIPDQVRDDKHLCHAGLDPASRRWRAEQAVDAGVRCADGWSA